MYNNVVCYTSPPLVRAGAAPLPPFPEDDVDVDDGDDDGDCGCGGDGCDDDHDDADDILCAFPQLLCRLAALVMRTLCLDIHSCVFGLSRNTHILVLSLPWKSAWLHVACHVNQILALSCVL